MKRSAILTASLFALGLAACGQAQERAPASSSPEPATNAAAMEMDDMGAAAPGGVGDAVGVIRSVSGTGDFVTVSHGPFEGDIAMGAMTMGFETMGGTDLSGFAEGDEVAIRVKQGRDGSYRIMAICKTAGDATACLGEREE